MTMAFLLECLQQPGAPVACLPKVIGLTIVGKHVLFVEGGKLK